MLSASKELEHGARAMLLFAEGLFRLDVVVSRDTLRTVMRNLSGAELESEQGNSGYADAGVEFGEAGDHAPAHWTMTYRLLAESEQIDVRIKLAALRFAQRGTVRITAQAVVRGVTPSS